MKNKQTFFLRTAKHDANSLLFVSCLSEAIGGVSSHKQRVFVTFFDKKVKEKTQSFIYACVAFSPKKPLLESSFYEINMDYCEYKNAEYKAFSIANITGCLDYYF